MFDVGFQELTLIGLIALIVVGPERLPRMARTLGLWMGKVRYYVGQVKSDIDREVRAQELREMLEKPARELDELKGVAEEARGVLGEAKTAFEGEPAGLSTPGEPAAGSIFPTELPDVGPAPGAPPAAGSAEAGSTPPSPAAARPGTASASAAEPVKETEPASSPPEDSPGTPSASPASAAKPVKETEPASSLPEEPVGTPSASPASAAKPATESVETVSTPHGEAAAPGRDGAKPADVESGAPETSSVTAEARESDERSSERA